MKYLIYISLLFTTLIFAQDKQVLVAVQSGVYAYMDSTSATTCTSADTWYAIQGTFTNSPMEGFIFDTDHITYKNGTQYFEINYNASVQSNNAGSTVHFNVWVNDAIVIEAAKMGTFLKFANEPIPVSGCIVLELSIDDEVKLVLESDNAGDVITINHYTTKIRPFFN